MMYEMIFALAVCVAWTDSTNVGGTKRSRCVHGAYHGARMRPSCSPEGADWFLSDNTCRDSVNMYMVMCSALYGYRGII